MKQLTTIVIDDEQHYIDLLILHISKTNTLHVLNTFVNPTLAAAYLEANKVDVVITDIEMPALSGIDLLIKYGHKSKFIVSSAYPQYAVDGYDFDIIDYLLKPVSYIRFTKAVAKITETFQEKLLPQPIESNAFMFVKTEAKGIRQKINYTDITLIEGKTNYIGIRTQEYEVPKLVLMNMKDIILQLPQADFIRVHSSFIIPLKNVIKIGGNLITLKYVDTKIPIGISYREVVYKAFNIGQ